MITELLFKTADGVFHVSREAALRHLDERRGAILMSLAHRLAKTDGKYSRILEILDEPGTYSGMRLLVDIEADKIVTGAVEE